ncbi:MAG TPA: type II toxin-antitoxin system HipA family toxin [Acidimicrobiales bacterium]
MSYSPADVVGVSVWGKDVGAVSLDSDTGFYVFEYEDSWLKDGVELAPIYMPRQRRRFIFPVLPVETFYRLPAMLADALPDRFGNYLVDAWMATQGISASMITPLDRLAYASTRAMGALTFRPPAGSSASEISTVQLADLVTAARAQIAGNLSDSEDVHRALAELITVGSSAGGARAKAVLAFNPTTGQMRSGQIEAPEGYEHWLMKFDGVGDPKEQEDPLISSQQYCRVEFAYYLMATAAGINMSESMLWPEGPRMHFMTRRFDRGPKGERIHSQTLCALAHLDYNARRTHAYETYFLTAQQLGLGTDSSSQIFRRAVFNVMSVNRDDHAKNFSFLLPEGEGWRLAPAYDVTHSNWGASWTQAQQMSVNGAFVGITIDDFRTMGDRFGVPGIEGIIADVAQAIENWREFAALADVDQRTTDSVASDLVELRPR